MATTAPPPPPTTSLDTVITVKVNFENVTRRVKMPLRDTTPQLLEKQVRDDSSILPFASYALSHLT
jgi:hypothetical protein